MEKFGQRLSDLRRSAGLKQEALAARLGVTQGQISKIENGKASVDEDLLDALCRVFGLATRYGLVGGTELAHMDSGRGLVSVSGTDGIAYLAYFASALTGLSDNERRQLFREAEWVRAVCEEHRVLLYEPRNYTDPVNNPEVTAEEVYAVDRAQVSESDIMILHCARPSFGAGQEIEIASAAGVPVILLIPAGVKVSRMVTGCYAMLLTVEYSERLSLETDLRRCISAAINGHVARRSPLDATELGRRIRERRLELGVRPETVAALVGTTKTAIAELETGQCVHQNPSLSLLRRLALALRTTVSFLVDGVRPLPEESNPVLAASKVALEQYATAGNLTLPEANDLWTAFVREYNADRRVVAEARSEPLSAEDWKQRHLGLEAPEPLQLFGLAEDE